MLTVLISNFIVSNFFPNLTYFQTNYPSMVNIYHSGFMTLQQNPLGWKQSDFKKTWIELCDIVSKASIKEQDALYYEILGFHTNIRQQLQFSFPSFQEVGSLDRLDELEEQHAKLIRSNYFEMGESRMMDQWNREAKFAFFIEAIEPYLKIQDRERWDYDLQDRNLMLNHFTLNLPLRFYKYLKNKEILQKDFVAIPIPRESPRLILRLHKKYASNL